MKLLQNLKFNYYKILIVGLLIIIFCTTVKYARADETNWDQITTTVAGYSDISLSDAIKTLSLNGVNLITYESPYINTPFSIRASNDYSVQFNDNAASWDILLQENTDIVQIDFSAQGTKSLEESLVDWLTSWRSKPLDVSYSIRENGYIENEQFVPISRNGLKYSLYKINSNVNYYMFIIDIGPMYKGRSHLAFSSQNLEMLLNVAKTTILIPN